MREGHGSYAGNTSCKSWNQANHVKKQSLLWKNLKRYRALFLMIIPGMIYLIINNYLPMFGVIIAFKDINYAKGILGSDWIGFKNFEYLFKTADAWIITRNTILYNGSFIIINTVMAIGVAILLERSEEETGVPVLSKRHIASLLNFHGRRRLSGIVDDEC